LGNNQAEWQAHINHQLEKVDREVQKVEKGDHKLDQVQTDFGNNVV